MGRPEDLFEQLMEGKSDCADSLISSRKSEELFLDFKRSADNGCGTRLHDTDRQNLARAISGFGNGAGGVIVWGVDCRSGRDGSDVACGKMPLSDAKKFVSWLESAISGCTIPPHPGVRNHAIVGEDGTQGFVVTLIPESHNAPHQCVGNMHYYMRAGSSFLPVPHQILAGMFGRRPAPTLVPFWSSGHAQFTQGALTFELGASIRNDGPGIARDIFQSIRVFSGSGGNTKIEFGLGDSRNWSHSSAFGFAFNSVCEHSYRLPPCAFAQPATIRFIVAPPFEIPVKIERTDGCEGIHPKTVILESSADAMKHAYDELMSAVQVASKQVPALKSFPLAFLGIT